MNKQLQTWEGAFGDAYMDRNDDAEWKLPLGIEGFRRMIGGLCPDSILEVGSNIGLNLMYIDRLFNQTVPLYAVEPNTKAFARLTSHPTLTLADAWNCSGFDMPLADASMDLVLTSGVLIHIAPQTLGQLTDEIVRVSRRYVLCSEYFSHVPEEVPYHGEQGLLFKRDFGAFYQERYPFLKIVDYGFLWMQEFKIFDNLNWWLFEKD